MRQKYDILDRYKRLPPKFQSKIGYDSLIQNDIPKELIIIFSTTIMDLDIELKIKIKRIKNLETKNSYSRTKILYHKWKSVIYVYLKKQK